MGNPQEQVNQNVLHFTLCNVHAVANQSACHIQTAENMDRAQQCLSWHHRKWLSAMLRNPLLAEVVSLAAIANGTLRKTRHTCCVFRYKHCKKKKRKRKVMFSRKLQLKEKKKGKASDVLSKLWLINTCYHHVSAPYVIPRLCSKSTCFLLHC